MLRAETRYWAVSMKSQLKMKGARMKKMTTVLSNNHVRRERRRFDSSSLQRPRRTITYFLISRECML